MLLVATSSVYPLPETAATEAISVATPTSIHAGCAVSSPKERVGHGKNPSGRRSDQRQGRAWSNPLHCTTASRPTCRLCLSAHVGALAHSDMRAAAGQRRQPGGLARSQAMLSGSLADPAQGASENGSHQFIVGTGPNDRGPAMYRGHVVADGLAPHPCCRLDLSILHRRS
ncbi:hypothetical protein xavtCFBP7764_14060 [Xanthomonas citri]|nr:hypothetical protein xavtCFBP7764_14060 [Xanthomonas citri]